MPLRGPVSSGHDADLGSRLVRRPDKERVSRGPLGRRPLEARAQGLTMSAFCAVRRPSDHPKRPRSYRPLDAFWQKRGYQPLPGVTAHFPWKDIGDSAETLKPLDFWGRQLGATG